MVKSTPVVATHDVLPPTIIEFLLDETGSMSRYLQKTLGGFRDFVDEQRKQNGLCLLTMTKFDTHGFRNPYADLDISMVPYLTANTYNPNGGTNLRDAIIHRMDDRYSRLSTWDIKPRVLFVCMTDGEDNASSTPVHHVHGRLLNAMEDNWTFVYLGAYPRSDRFAKELGFPAGNIRCFEGSQIQETMQELAVATSAYRASTTATTNFYSR